MTRMRERQDQQIDGRLRGAGGEVDADHGAGIDLSSAAAFGTGGSDEAPSSAAERSPVEPAVSEGRDPGWEELLELAERTGPSDELAAVDDRALERLVCTGAARIAAEMCHWLDLVAELVIRRIWADEGARTPASWLSWAVGMSPTAARDHVRVALRLRELSRLREEFAAGRISYSKVRAITRVAMPETEETLIEWSRMATGADMERIVGGFRTAQRAKAAASGSDQPARQVRLRPRSDGTSEVIIRMPDEEAHALYAGANRLVDLEDAERNRTDDEDDGATEPPRLRVVDDEAPSDSAESPPVKAVSPEDRPRPARLADAILEAVQSAVAAGGADTTGNDRHTLVVHVDGDDLAVTGSSDGAGDSLATDDAVAVETPHGGIPAMSRRVLRRMACDAGLVLVSTDADGSPIDVGHRQRHLSTALRRALITRDRSCRFPGCGARRHLHGHHIHHWADDGPTDLANLVLVCSFHHRYVHDHEIQVRLRPGAAHEFRFPNGRRIARVRKHAATRQGTPQAEVAPGLSGEAAPDALRPVHWDGRYCLDTTIAVLQQQVEAVLPQAAVVQAA